MNIYNSMIYTGCLSVPYLQMNPQINHDIFQQFGYYDVIWCCHNKFKTQIFCFLDKSNLFPTWT